VDSWPWVVFFCRKKKGLWALNEVKHTVVHQDILRKLHPPDTVMSGTRLLYTSVYQLAKKILRDKFYDGETSPKTARGEMFQTCY